MLSQKKKIKNAKSKKKKIKNKNKPYNIPLPNRQGN
jgi:hypothetical protein